MKVRVDELPDGGRIIHFHELPNWFSSRMETTEDAREITLARPVNVDLELIPETGQVRLSGHLRTAVRLACSRCVQDFVVELDESMDMVLLRPLPAETPEEIDLRPQDLDTEFYDGVTIDVDLIVAEQIFLTIPQKPLCQPNCRGICLGCGVDLNQASCVCENKASGSAFDVLRSMKIDP
ncbi:MAG: DUF177 domain-containing protein [Deltaproteobacteria bacterium]|nr:MAG: DUF177 domain-containing protein [Deltaproteobacteria bacterium]